VLHNVLVPARLARKRGLEGEARRLLTTLGLSHRLEHLPHQLSIGQKRRVAVARALLLEPVVVFADEPTNDLDAEPRRPARPSCSTSCPARAGLWFWLPHDRGLVGRADHTVNLSGVRA